MPSGSEPQKSTPTVADLDRADRLIREGGDLVLNPEVVDSGRLDEIRAELRTMLWCPSCQTERFDSCERRREHVKVNAAGQRHRTVSRSVCPMLGWVELVKEARARG